MAKAGRTGVSAKTPKQIFFGAGTVHFDFDVSATDHTSTIIGATSGGSTLTITPEITPIEADGALVAGKGLKVKTGEVATLKINFLELPQSLLQAAVLGEGDTSTVAGHGLIKSKARIEEGDYYENIALVGQTVDGQDIIVILKNALCISGLELGTENKNSGVAELEFECHADLDGDLDTLPWEIHYPTVA